MGNQTPPRKKRRAFSYARVFLCRGAWCWFLCWGHEAFTESVNNSRFALVNFNSLEPYFWTFGHQLSQIQGQFQKSAQAKLQQSPQNERRTLLHYQVRWCFVLMMDSLQSSIAVATVFLQGLDHLAANAKTWRRQWKRQGTRDTTRMRQES